MGSAACSRETGGVSEPSRCHGVLACFSSCCWEAPSKAASCPTLLVECRRLVISMHLKSRKEEARCHWARRMLQFGTESLSRVGILVAEEGLRLQAGCHFGVSSGRAKDRTLEEEGCILAVRCWGHRNSLVLKGKTYPADTQDESRGLTAVMARKCQT